MKMTIKKIILLPILCLFSLSLYAVDFTKLNVVEAVAQNSDRSIFVDAIKAAGLEEILKGKGLFLLFVPTNEAFAKLPKKSLEKLSKNKEQLKQVIAYHILLVPQTEGSSTKPDIKEGNVTTLNGQNLKVKKQGNDILVNDVKLMESGAIASNGVIYEIDTVLISEKIEMIE